MSAESGRNLADLPPAIPARRYPATTPPAVSRRNFATSVEQRISPETDSDSASEVDRRLMPPPAVPFPSKFQRRLPTVQSASKLPEFNAQRSFRRNASSSSLPTTPGFPRKRADVQDGNAATNGFQRNTPLRSTVGSTSSPNM